MTSNQLQYWRNVETNRSNLAQERETNRANLARELETNRANMAQEKETNRANLAREQETHRSNIVNERLRTEQLLSDVRNQVKQRELQWYNAKEIQRSNKAREAETARSNKAKEQISTLNYDLERYKSNLDYNIRSRQQSTAYYDAETRRLAHMESVRSNRFNQNLNLLNSKETMRSNAAREAEQHRANVEQENISRFKSNDEHNRNVETARHNRAMENIAVYQSNQQLLGTIMNVGSNAAINTARIIGGAMK